MTSNWLASKRFHNLRRPQQLPNGRHVKHIDDPGGRTPLASSQTAKPANTATCYIIFVAYIACVYGVAQKALYESRPKNNSFRRRDDLLDFFLQDFE